VLHAFHVRVTFNACYVRVTFDARVCNVRHARVHTPGAPILFSITRAFSHSDSNNRVFKNTIVRIRMLLNGQGAHSGTSSRPAPTRAVDMSTETHLPSQHDTDAAMPSPATMVRCVCMCVPLHTLRCMANRVRARSPVATLHCRGHRASCMAHAGAFRSHLQGRDASANSSLTLTQAITISLQAVDASPSASPSQHDTDAAMPSPATMVRCVCMCVPLHTLHGQHLHCRGHQLHGTRRRVPCKCAGVMCACVQVCRQGRRAGRRHSHVHENAFSTFRGTLRNATLRSRFCVATAPFRRSTRTPTNRARRWEWRICPGGRAVASAAAGAGRLPPSRMVKL
jgi:hypothetical protein